MNVYVDKARQAFEQEQQHFIEEVVGATVFEKQPDPNAALKVLLLTVHIESCTKFDERTNTPCSPRWHCETALQYLPKED